MNFTFHDFFQLVHCPYAHYMVQSIIIVILDMSEYIENDWMNVVVEVEPEVNEWTCALGSWGVDHLWHME